MNRKMFSLVTSLAILSSSLSPTWAAGKDFTYYELNKNLPTKAEVKSVENAEEKQALPLVREDMPDDSVKDKYMRIIFVPETSLVNGVQNYGKLIDKEGKDVPIVKTSYKIYSKVFSVKGKEYYVLKDAKWLDVLRYKENDKLIFLTREADNNEVETDKKNNHKFLGWKKDYYMIEPFSYGYKIKLEDFSIEKPLVFKSVFQSMPYFYSDEKNPNVDPDGYDFFVVKNDYSRIEFKPVGQENNWAGVISLKDSQKKFSLKDIQNAKYIYLYIGKDSGPYKFGDFKPEPISSENKKFWFWSLNFDLSKAVKDDFEIGSKDLSFRAQYIGEYLKIDDKFNLDENPIPEGFYEVNFKHEEGYSSISNFNYGYRKFAVREGCGVGNITNLPESPKLKDTNNNEYQGPTAWYDGYTKIDDIKKVKINSNKVFTARAVRDFESEKFDPVVKEVEVNLNEDVSPEKLKEGITNLPDNIKVEVNGKADTSKVGPSRAILKIIFPDTSFKEVEVPLKVVEKIDGGIIKPIPTIKAEDIIKEEVSYNGEINLLDNIKNLPDGVRVENISDPIDTKVPGTYIGKIKVTFKDGSSRIIEISVEVLVPLSDSYNPSTKEVEVNLNEDVSPEKLKEGITNLPDNIKVEVTSKADTSKVGPSKAIVKIIFPDTSFKEVEIPVKVVEKIDGGIIKPIPTIKAEDIIKEEVSYMGEVNLLDNIKNLPEGARVEDVSDPIDTKVPGTYTGKVKVTFKDGSSRIIEIPVEVLGPLADKFPVKNPEKTEVEKLESLSPSEKSEIIEKFKKANPQVVSVEVSDKGDVTLVYADGSRNVIKSEDLLILKKKTSDDKKPSDNEEDKKEEENKDKGNTSNKKEEDKNNEDNKLDSWNGFPRYYVRDHKTATYKVEAKIDSQVSNKKTKFNPKKFVIDIKSGTYTITENGKTSEKTMEVKPFIETNRTMLPLRALAEILDAKVIWNDATRTASFTRDGLTALIQIDGNKIALSNGETIDLDAKPLNIKGRIYLPLVYVGQVFGLTRGNTLDGERQDIEWDNESKTVTINIK